MSLMIDVDRVRAVLLIDGWHEVEMVDERSTFDLDAYEYHQDKRMLLKGGMEKLIPSTGATWKEPLLGQVYCPLTSVLAVRY